MIIEKNTAGFYTAWYPQAPLYIGTGSTHFQALVSLLERLKLESIINY